MRSRLVCSMVFVCVAAFLHIPALAQDGGEVGIEGVRLESMSIGVKVSGRLATTTMDLVFASTRVNGQAVLQWRMAPDAVVHDLVLWVEGLRIPCEVCPRKSARATYDRIISGLRDPAIVEYLGDGVWNLSVFPVSPGSSRKVRVVYSQMLGGGQNPAYVAPRVMDASPCRKAGMLDFEAEIDCPGGVKDFVAKQQMGIVRQGRSADNMGKVIAGFRSANRDANDGIAFMYESAKPLPRVLSAPAEVDPNGKPGGSRVYIFDPNTPEGFSDKAVKARNIVLVLDKSGSMAGEPWKTASAAAMKILANLTEQDRFSVVVGGPEPRLWENSLWAPTEANIDDVKRMIHQVEPDGGTDLAGALRAAASFQTSSKHDDPVDIIVISDGWDHVAARRITTMFRPDDPNDPNCPAPPCRIFALGVAGRNPGLEDLARKSGGAAAFVHEPLAVDKAVSLLLAQLRRTAVTDVDAWAFPGAAQGENRKDSDVTVLAMSAGRWPGAIGWVRGKDVEQYSLIVSARFNGRPASAEYNSIWLTEPDPNSLTAQDEENIRRIYAHMACQTRYPRMERPEATPDELAVLLDLCRRRHIASSGSALLVLESDSQYGEMGVGRITTILGATTPLSDLEKASRPYSTATDPEEMKERFDYEKKQRETIARLLAEGKLTEAFSAASNDSRALSETEGFALYKQAVCELVEIRRQRRREQERQAEQRRRKPEYAADGVKPSQWHEAAAAYTPAQLVPTAARLAIDVTPELTQAEKEQRAGLNDKASKIEFDDVDLPEAISKLERAAKLNILIRWAALKKAGLNELSKVTVTAEEAPARDSLRTFLSAIKSKKKLSYIVDGTDVIISTESDLPKIPLMRLYDLRPILCGLPCYEVWLDWDPFVNGYRSDLGDIAGTSGTGGGGGGIFGGDTAAGGGGGGVFFGAGSGDGEFTLLVEEETRAEPGSVFEIWREDGKHPFHTDRIKPGAVFAPSEQRGEESDYIDYDYAFRQRVTHGRLAQVFPSREQVVRKIYSRVLAISSNDRPAEDYETCSWFLIYNGLLGARQPQAVQTRIADIIRELNTAAHNGRLADAYLPHWPESIFTRQATIEQWTADLLQKARAGTLSQFSSAKIENLPGRRMVRIGGIWFDAAMTAEMRIYTVARMSPAGRAVSKALGDGDECLALAGPVIIPAGAEMAICLDQAGIRDEKDPDLQRLLAALKAAGPTTRPASAGKRAPKGNPAPAARPDGKR